MLAYHRRPTPPWQQAQQKASVPLDEMAITRKQRNPDGSGADFAHQADFSLGGGLWQRAPKTKADERLSVMVIPTPRGGVGIEQDIRVPVHRSGLGPSAAAI